MNSLTPEERFFFANELEEDWANDPAYFPKVFKPATGTWWDQLRGFARTQLAAGHCQLAVIMAHTAGDLATESALQSVLQDLGLGTATKPLYRLLPKPISLNDNRVREAWFDFTGDNPSALPWWESFKKARGLRNAVVHRGEPVDAPRATEALDVVDQLIAYVTSVAEKTHNSPQQAHKGSPNGTAQSG